MNKIMKGVYQKPLNLNGYLGIEFQLNHYKKLTVTAFCLLVYQMCGKGTFSQIRSWDLNALKIIY